MSERPHLRMAIMRMKMVMAFRTSMAKLRPTWVVRQWRLGQLGAHVSSGAQAISGADAGRAQLRREQLWCGGWEGSEPG